MQARLLPLNESLPERCDPSVRISQQESFCLAPCSIYCFGSPRGLLAPKVKEKHAFFVIGWVSRCWSTAGNGADRGKRSRPRETEPTAGNGADRTAMGACQSAETDFDDSMTEPTVTKEPSEPSSVKPTVPKSEPAAQPVSEEPTPVIEPEPQNQEVINARMISSSCLRTATPPRRPWFSPSPHSQSPRQDATKPTPWHGMDSAASAEDCRQHAYDELYRTKGDPTQAQDAGGIKIEKFLSGLQIQTQSGAMIVSFPDGTQYQKQQETLIHTYKDGSKWQCQADGTTQEIIPGDDGNTTVQTAKDGTKITLQPDGSRISECRPDLPGGTIT
jgi:hypothetical protein